jgi:hypothetical protein
MGVSAAVHISSTLRDSEVGHHDSRTGAEGCDGVGGIALFGSSLSFDDVSMAMA